MQREMNVLALVKNSERYVFLYDDDSLDSVLQTLGRYAADKELSFSWYDAAVLSQKVRKLNQANTPVQTLAPPKPKPKPVNDLRSRQSGQFP